jgi:hypothetical protein
VPRSLGGLVDAFLREATSLAFMAVISFLELKIDSARNLVVAPNYL